ncbi:MAG TPA: peptide deformylase [Aliidongia sp.]|uniref:peptide deformylase n=1 Tax=Aliidongia sp. TaxID=1914230 RepID=UPI002DDD3D1C|nr:peptide deformylase [Aliidongia sp.]HEV2674977.1 peptide deformylase [Aliidongia sp.]
MSILKIARMGHPVLRRVADPVADPTAPDVAQLVRDMIETLEDIGGVGLAAPQVHVSRRVIIFKVPEARTTDIEGDAPLPLTALINPTIEPVGDALNLGWEGCLSIPGLRGAVPRYTTIRYRGFAPDGSVVEREAVGFHARVVQHEFDHLNGVLYPERMNDLSLLAFLEEGQKHPIDLAAYARGEVE